MRQKIQRLLLFPVGMSSLVLVSEPMIPSMLPALAAAGQDTVTVHQNNSHEQSQNPGQIDGKVIAQKNELTSATGPSHRLIGRTPSPQTSVQINNNASGQPSLSTSPVASFGATPTVQPTSSLLGVTAQISQAVAAPQAGPMQTQPSTAPMRRLLSEIPGLKQLVAPSITISPPPSLKPAIGVSSSSFSFSLQQGDGSPTTQTLTVTNIGEGTLDWNAVSSAAWLNLSPASGKAAGTIALTATTGSLAVGTYTALVTISAANATPVSIPVTFTVTPPSPTLTVNPTAVTFSGVQGGPNPASQSVTVMSNSNWTASSSVPWLTLSPSSGSGNGSIAANVTLASAVVGPNQATITVTSGGVTRTTAVTLTVAGISLAVAPNSLTYTATQGAANPAAQTITISANGAWTVSDNASWLSLSPTSGSKNGTITASVNTVTATRGPNSTTITVTSGGITRTVNVTLTLNPQASSSVTLTWNANTESDLAGYKVYRANSSGAYGAPIAAIPGNTTSYIVTGLQFGTTYFFVVTAYDIAGNESAYSNEVSRSIF